MSHLHFTSKPKVHRLLYIITKLLSKNHPDKLFPPEVLLVWRTLENLIPKIGILSNIYPVLTIKFPNFRMCQSNYLKQLIVDFCTRLIILIRILLT